jgi:hypothetical protein
MMGLFEPDSDDNLGGEISKRTFNQKDQRQGMLERLVEKSGGAVPFNKVDVEAAGTKGKVEEKGLIVPKINYISDGDEDGQSR